MRRLLLLTFAASLLSAAACSDATSPPSSARLAPRHPQRTLSIPSTSPYVSAGRLHSCGLKSDGTVVCWGGIPDYENVTAIPVGLSSVVQLSAGGFHTCALIADGSLTCWGYNDHGELAVPVGLTSVAHVSAGFTHACALETNQTVVCWGGSGDVDYGQSIVPPDLGPVKQVSAGGYHTCALKIDQTVVCWGSHDEGQSDVPAGLTSVAQVSAGYIHTCALKTDGTVICWGAQDFEGTDYSYGQADVPPGLSSVTQVAAGGGHSCALKVDETVVCWGASEPAEFGSPAGLGSVVELSAGTLHSCALKRDGTVVCWGMNDRGQMDVPIGLNLAAITNVAPILTALSGPTAPVALGSPVVIVGKFTDPGYSGDAYTITATWSSSGSIPSSTTVVTNYSGGTGNDNGSFTLTPVGIQPGVYTLSVTIADKFGLLNTNAEGVYSTLPGYIVVYDPNAGFVTGGGWITSPAGAYYANRSLTGKATFGFVAKYQKGQQSPDGNTEFEFQTAGLAFKATSYEWLIVAGTKAQYKGVGTINGSGTYGFMLTAIDGDSGGSKKPDTFRIKIWVLSTGAPVYDNQLGAADASDPTTILGGGTVVIRSK
jgi:hypothetical protein